MKESKASPANLAIGQNYDSEFCGSIPLHLVNLIQPHGVLLVLDKEELRVVQASENVETYLGIPAADLLNQPLAQFLPEEEFEEMRSKLKRQGTQDKIPFTLRFKSVGQEVIFIAVLIPQQEYILVELESSQLTAQTNFIGMYQHVKFVTSMLKHASSIPETAQVAAAELKRFSGFDRVLVYRFDQLWNGLVIAQAREEDMEDYMGLRFPASDVPRQARELYYRNPYRLIPTNNYAPVRLIPIINPLTRRFTDLSECSLRSVPRVHLEYLTNMRITASMSLPIIIDNKLWGLISCHHKTERNPGYEVRSAMELLAGIMSAQLEAKQREEDMALRVHLRSIHVEMLKHLYTHTDIDFDQGLLHEKSGIMDLLALEGAAIVYEGNIRTRGNCPTEQELKDLVSWLRRQQQEGVFATHTLPEIYPHSKIYKSVASGLIAIAINAEQGEYILGFRPEVLQTLHWGGNPNEAIRLEPDGKTYHPRNSFAIYSQTVQNTSLPWQQVELEAAESLRTAVLEKVIKERY